MKFSQHCAFLVARHQLFCISFFFSSLFFMSPQWFGTCDRADSEWQYVLYIYIYIHICTKCIVCNVVCIHTYIYMDYEGNKRGAAVGAGAKWAQELTWQITLWCLYICICMYMYIYFLYAYYCCCSLVGLVYLLLLFQHFYCMYIYFIFLFQHLVVFIIGCCMLTAHYGSSRMWEGQIRSISCFSCTTHQF